VIRVNLDGVRAERVARARPTGAAGGAGVGRAAADRGPAGRARKGAADRRRRSGAPWPPSVGSSLSNNGVSIQFRPTALDNRAREGAACHGCLLIAEPSCERMNRDLDRAFVVPTVDEDSAECAFFGAWMG
jgi:hypothetical protein